MKMCLYCENETNDLYCSEECRALHGVKQSEMDAEMSSISEQEAEVYARERRILGEEA